jgi:hypothetical protein
MADRQSSMLQHQPKQTEAVAPTKAFRGNFRRCCDTFESSFATADHRTEADKTDPTSRSVCLFFQLLLLHP